MTLTLTERTTSLSVQGAVEAVQQELRSLSIRLFALIDHGARAAEAGLPLPDEVVLIFGDPAVGTVLMQADARVGLDLPLRLLIRDDGGTTTLAYRDPLQLGDGFLLEEQRATLERLSAAMRRIVASVPE